MLRVGKWLRTVRDVVIVTREVVRALAAADDADAARRSAILRQVIEETKRSTL